MNIPQRRLWESVRSKIDENGGPDIDTCETDVDGAFIAVLVPAPLVAALRLTFAVVSGVGGGAVGNTNDSGSVVDGSGTHDTNKMKNDSHGHGKGLCLGMSSCRLKVSLATKSGYQAQRFFSRGKSRRRGAASRLMVLPLSFLKRRTMSYRDAAHQKYHCFVGVVRASAQLRERLWIDEVCMLNAGRGCATEVPHFILDARLKPGAPPQGHSSLLSPEYTHTRTIPRSRVTHRLVD